LVRVIATAVKSGATSALLLYPRQLSEEWLKASLRSPILSSVAISTVALDEPFDPENPSHWRAVRNRLEDRFLWLPWNLIADSRALATLIAKGKTAEYGTRLTTIERPEGAPAVIVATRLFEIWESNGQASDRLTGILTQFLAKIPSGFILDAAVCGWAVRSAQTARHAERELIRRSGKEWDGMHSKFNRRLCRPLVRWLSKTPVTPNMVTLAGLPVAFISGYWFAQGHWSAYVLGALLYFVTVLFDEIDGMLARTTFRESAFGCWLESFVDYASYIPVFSGMAIGLYRQHGRLWLGMGGLLLFGTVTTFLVATWHRRLACSIDKPSEYLNRYYRLLEADSANIVSRFVRQVHFFVKKGVLCHYVLIFSVLGGLKILFALAAFGSNLAWILGLSTGRLLRPALAGQPNEWKHPAASLRAR
jgi:phosphatidylglycerophosphate synthase